MTMLIGIETEMLILMKDKIIEIMIEDQEEMTILNIKIDIIIDIRIKTELTELIDIKDIRKIIFKEETIKIHFKIQIKEKVIINLDHIEVIMIITNQEDINNFLL